MTVPLKYNDEVVGTLNVESPRLSGFGPDDLQFTELFSKEIAAALHTLDLLTAQNKLAPPRSRSTRSTGRLFCRWTMFSRAPPCCSAGSATTPKRRINCGASCAARAVKENIQKVGRDCAGRTAYRCRRRWPANGYWSWTPMSEWAAVTPFNRLGRANVETAATAGEGLVAPRRDAV